MPPLVSSQFPLALLKHLDQLRRENYLCDCKLVVSTPEGPNEEFNAHKLVLAASSPYFRQLFASQSKEQQRQTVTVNLNHCTAECVYVIVQFLYSGQLNLLDCDPASVLKVAKACQISSLEEMLSSSDSSGSSTDSKGGLLSKLCNTHKLMSCLCSDNSTSSLPYSPQVSSPLQVNVPDGEQSNGESNPGMGDGDHGPLGYTLSGTPTGGPMSAPAMLNSLSMANAIVASSMAALAANAANRAGYYGPLLPTTPQCESPSSAPPFPSSPFSSLFPQFTPYQSSEGPAESPRKPQSKGTNIVEDTILPSNEKEGWCRNKKYIQKVDSGYMCIVCKKIYGRYNSVSYHVTIYHRNPPIKCDEPGCQFTTREARYIHFHKYYRHGTPLPDSIDLGTRSCPFCRHVAKSPAMLEKHVARHLPDTKLMPQPIKCGHCDDILTTQKDILVHQVKHAKEKHHQCSSCSYKGRSSNSLQQHILFKHSNDLFHNNHQCTMCDYKAPNSPNLKAHTRRKHRTSVEQNSGCGSGTEEEELAVPPPSQCTDDIEEREGVSSELDDSHSKLTAATTGYHSMVDYGRV